MTHYLRRNGETIAEVEAGHVDLHCVVHIGPFSRMLLRCPSTGIQGPLIAEFEDLQEMRGEWHEDPEQVESPDEFCERKLRAVAEYWNLEYVTD